jgi:hypothetical protein
MDLERLLTDSIPMIIAMSTLSIAGLLWSLQVSVGDIKAQQSRLLDLVKDSQARILTLENRVRDLELKTADGK